MFVVRLELFEIALKYQRFVFLKEVVSNVEGHQPGAALGGHEGMDRAQVARLTAERRSVVDELDGQFARGEIELHRDL